MPQAVWEKRISNAARRESRKEDRHWFLYWLSGYAGKGVGDRVSDKSHASVLGQRQAGDQEPRKELVCTFRGREIEIGKWDGLHCNVCFVQILDYERRAFMHCLLRRQRILYCATLIVARRNSTDTLFLLVILVHPLQWALYSFKLSFLRLPLFITLTWITSQGEQSTWFKPPNFMRKQNLTIVSQDSALRR